MMVRRRWTRGATARALKQAAEAGVARTQADIAGEAWACGLMCASARSTCDGCEGAPHPLMPDPAAAGPAARGPQGAQAARRPPLWTRSTMAIAVGLNKGHQVRMAGRRAPQVAAAARLMLPPPDSGHRAAPGSQWAPGRAAWRPPCGAAASVAAQACTQRHGRPAPRPARDAAPGGAAVERHAARWPAVGHEGGRTQGDRQRMWWSGSGGQRRPDGLQPQQGPRRLRLPPPPLPGCRRHCRAADVPPHPELSTQRSRRAAWQHG